MADGFPDMLQGTFEKLYAKEYKKFPKFPKKMFKKKALKKIDGKSIRHVKYTLGHRDWRFLYVDQAY